VVTGTISRVFLPRGFAFITGEDNLTYFFQVEQLAAGSWDGATIHPGVQVTFVPMRDGAKGNGLRATQVNVDAV